MNQTAQKHVLPPLFNYTKRTPPFLHEQWHSSAWQCHLKSMVLISNYHGIIWYITIYTHTHTHMQKCICIY